MTTKPPLQKILQGILHTKHETIREQEISKHRRKDKEPQSSIGLAGHNQILKQQTQLNGRIHHTPININTEYQLLNSLMKRHHLGSWIKKEDPTIFSL
jgi:hypothetical protein